MQIRGDDIVRRGGVSWSYREEGWRQAAECGAQASLRCPCAPSPVRKKEKAPSGGRPLPPSQPSEEWGKFLWLSPPTLSSGLQRKKVKHLSLSPPLVLFLPSPILWRHDVAPFWQCEKSKTSQFASIHLVKIIWTETAPDIKSCDIILTTLWTCSVYMYSAWVNLCVDM